MLLYRRHRVFLQKGDVYFIIENGRTFAMPEDVKEMLFKLSIKCIDGGVKANNGFSHDEYIFVEAQEPLASWLKTQDWLINFDAVDKLSRRELDELIWAKFKEGRKLDRKIIQLGNGWLDERKAFHNYTAWKLEKRVVSYDIKQLWRFRFDRKLWPLTPWPKRLKWKVPTGELAIS